MPDRRVVLYQDEGRGGSWIVDAEITADGGISICSGDGSAEWYAIVDRAAKPMLVEALRKHLNVTEPGRPDMDDDILDLLVRAFSRRSLLGPGPYPEIRRFLDKNRVPWRSDFWGSL